MKEFRLYQCMLQRNRWYGKTRSGPVQGIVVHSAGVNNPELRRYVNPYDGQKTGMGRMLPKAETYGYYKCLEVIGTNQYNNHWNSPNQPYGMHAWVGKLADGTVAAVQTLPWDAFLWGCGSGRNGSYNTSHIQFECCEDTTDQRYTDQAYEVAVQLCAYLCQTFGLRSDQITSHVEAHQAGYASNHADPMHWWSLYGHSMDELRRDVGKILMEIHVPDDVEVTVGHAVTDIGLNSPDYWEDVIRGAKVAWSHNVKALMDKYHKAMEELRLTVETQKMGDYVPDEIAITVAHAEKDIGLNRPYYWDEVLRGWETASGPNIQALMDKYHQALEELKRK